MRLNDFVKKDDIKKQSAYKVVVGNSPKEQELAKEALKVTSLQSSVDESNAKLSDLQKENDFLKEQVKINQHEKDEFKVKANNLEDIKIQLIEKENRLTDVLEETHELAIKETTSKELVKDLKIKLNDKTGELEVLQTKYTNIELELTSITANYNGISSELDRIKDFSDKTQSEYNKLRDRNTALMQEREDLSRLKAEFEVKSIRLGDELNKTQEKLRNTQGDLADAKNANDSKDKEAINAENLNTKFKADVRKLKMIADTSEEESEDYGKLQDTISNFLDNKNQLKVTRDTKERMQSLDWNVAKKEVKLGNATTYPNKLGFGASTFFKLNDEETMTNG